MSSILSFGFIAFFFLVSILYYLLPKRFQWGWLLICSLFFFICISGLKRLPFMLADIIATYVGALLITRAKHVGTKRVVLAFSIIFPVLMLLALKVFDTQFIVLCNICLEKLNVNRALAAGRSVLAPIGISYFTLSIIGYILDVYWEKCPAQKNIFKHCLYVCYFPALTSGPIVMYGQMADKLFTPHEFNYTSVKFGFQRMLWGYIKKLVVADRLAILTATVFADTSVYSGLYIPFAVLCFAFQIYMDFSGCMDIVLGASEVFQITMPENFNRPFYAQTLSEFWRRWHMTLGLWSKEYILYPLLKTSLFQMIGKKSKRLLGKRIGKNIPTYIGLGIVWLIIGIWHGGSAKYIFASGFLPWFFMVSGQLLQPAFDWLTKMLRINTDCFSYRLFGRLRTLFLMCIVWFFATAKSFRQSFSVMKNMVSVFNPWIFTDGSIFKLGLDQTNVFLIILFFIFVTAIAYFQEKGMHMRECIAKQNLVFRWTLYLCAIFFVLIFAIYGPGYDAAEFIYQGF